MTSATLKELHARRMAARVAYMAGGSSAALDDLLSIIMDEAIVRHREIQERKSIAPRASSVLDRLIDDEPHDDEAGLA